MPSIGPDRLDVVAAIVRDASGKILLSQRPAHKHQGGRWEFPGGKVEAGESLHQALARELREELGVGILSSSPFMTIDHQYSDLAVRLYFREVLSWQGTPQAREQQPFNWFALDQLQLLTFPAANKPVVVSLSLPHRWLVLPDDFSDHPEDWIAHCIKSNVGGVYLRGARGASVTCLRGIICACKSAGLLCLVRDDLSLAQQLHADGVHFSEAVGMTISARPDIRLVSMACHGEEGLAQAQKLGADMVMLSPVQTTSTHLLSSPLGWEQFERLATGRPFSVYALGGVGEQDIQLAMQHGGRGIAAISAFWPEC